MIASVNGLDFKTVEKETDVHSLPCKIHYNGEANIADYFQTNNDTTDESVELNASFRGYPLNGKEISLPETYHGFILESKRPGKLEQIKKFGSMTYWDWDKYPSRNDPFLSALDWLSLSSQVHDPVEED